MTDYISIKSFIERVKDIPFWGSVAVLIAEQLPAADVREVKRGKWQHTTEPCGWREYECASCSVCGDSFILDEWGMDDFTSLMNFCPNCGADMREEQT